MKNYQLLSICITTALLTACGSGGGSTSATPNGKLPQNYEVPDNLKQAVKKAMSLPVYWEPAPGYQESAIMGSKSYRKGDFIDLTDLDLGYSEKSYKHIEDKGWVEKGTVRVYRQNYSAIMAFTPTDIKLSSNNPRSTEKDDDGLSEAIGYLTENLPQTGKATYQGKAFYQNETGNFNLNVNFGDKKVAGKITGLSSGEVTLQKGDIVQTEYEYLTEREKVVNTMGYKGVATLPDNGKFIEKVATVTKNGITNVKDKVFEPSTHTFKYEGYFFGPNAKETAGDISAYNRKGYDGTNINFAGQRGEIKK